MCSAPGDTTEMFNRVIHDEPDLDGIPDKVRPLVENCLAKDPQERPSLAQLLSELSPLTAESIWLTRRSAWLRDEPEVRLSLYHRDNSTAADAFRRLFLLDP
jgi:hypothetical protein